MRQAVRRTLPGVAVLLGGLATVTLEAQVVRDFRSSRPLAGEGRLSARIELQEGAFSLGAAAPGTLYEFDLAFDPERYEPVTRRDAGGLQLGVRGERSGAFRFKPRARLVQQGSVRLSSEVEWALSLGFGGVEAELDFAGVPITGLAVDAEASRTVLRFPETNPSLCREAVFEISAGELTLERFGNSGCRSVTVTGAFGRLLLDLSGALAGDVTADLGLTAGSLVLLLPRGVGVRVRSSELVALFDSEGLIRQGEYWMTQGYGDARRKLDLTLSSRFAKVSLEWEAP